MMGRALADEGHAALLAPFIEARHPPVVGKALSALGANARSSGAHPATALSTTATAGAHAASLPTTGTGASSSTEAGPCSLALAPSLSATSSSAFHLVLLVGIVFSLN